MTDIYWRFRYWMLKTKENLILEFWSRVPNSILYWAVNQAWARATVEKYTDKHPDEVTWSMTAQFLDGK